jgi:hypothetical protein
MITPNLKSELDLLENTIKELLSLIYLNEDNQISKKLITGLPEDNSLISIISIHRKFVDSVNKNSKLKLSKKALEELKTKIKVLDNIKENFYDYLENNYEILIVILEALENLINLYSYILKSEDLKVRPLILYLTLRIIKVIETLHNNYKGNFKKQIELLDDLNSYIEALFKEKHDITKTASLNIEKVLKELL